VGIREVRRAVFLDRDGTLNHLVPRLDGTLASPRSLAEFKLINGIARQVERIHKAGFMAILATNQPDVARGFLDARVLESMHEELMKQAPLDGIMVCPHDDPDDCTCRMPRPGLLIQARNAGELIWPSPLWWAIPGRHGSRPGGRSERHIN
jgi:D-glycero-D-manno-heptose 1,7-bisphosphate phosphatase